LPLLLHPAGFFFGPLGLRAAEAAVSDAGEPRVLWKHDLESTNAFLSVAPNGNLYVLESQGPTGNTTLEVYDPKGTQLWRAAFRFGNAYAAPIFAANGTAYFIAGDRVAAYAPDGRMAWSYVILAQLSDMSSFAPCLVLGPDGTLYSGGAYLYAFGPSGALKWQLRVKDRVAVSCPAFSSKGQLFASSEKGLHRISAEGRELEVLPGIAPNAKPAGVRGSVLFFLGRVAMGTGNQDNSVFAINDEGKLLWQFAQGPRVAGVLSTRQGIVVGGGVMDLLDEEGHIVWSLETPIAAVPAALRDGTLLGGCSEGADLCAYDSKGQVLWYFAQTGALRGFLPTPIAAGSNGEVYLVKGTALLALLPPRVKQRK
jgi:outer membrane protein assembly factor BamB